MEKRFRALRIIGTILKILAWAVLILGILGGIVLIVGGVAGGFAGASSLSRDMQGLGVLGSLFTGLVGGVFVVIVSVLYFLFLYASADVIYLGLAIEENTRETAHYLKGGDAFARRV